MLDQFLVVRRPEHLDGEVVVPAEPENWVWLARIRRPQGRKGEVLAEILTDFPEKFAQRRQLWLIEAAGAHESGSAIRQKKSDTPGSSPLGTQEARSVLPQARQVELVNYWRHKDAIVLHFAGVDSISAAEELKGLIVAIPREERTPLGDGEAYIGDLIGCMLVDVAGADPVDVGVIEDVDRATGAAVLLVVRGKNGEVLVPFAKSYLRRTDLEGKQIEMALPEGLVELNER